MVYETNFFKKSISKYPLPLRDRTCLFFASTSTEKSANKLVRKSDSVLLEGTTGEFKAVKYIPIGFGVVQGLFSSKASAELH